jgi:hypothetical protein
MKFPIDNDIEPKLQGIEILGLHKRVVLEWYFKVKQRKGH